MFLRQTFNRLGVLRRNYCQNPEKNIDALTQNVSATKLQRNIATIRREANSSDVVVQFVYSNDALKYRKLITCVRQLHESIPLSMEKVKIKILDKIARKLKKKDLTLSSDNFHVKLEGLCAEHDNWEKLLDNFNGNETNFVLKIDNDIYAIEYNPPSIETIQLPEQVYPGFDCYPSKLDVCGDSSKCTCTFKWKRRLATSKKWIPCENEESIVYRVPANEIGSELQLMCTVTNKDGVVISERKSNQAYVTEKAPNMEAIERRHKYTPHILADHQFRVVTYNLLANFYTDTDYSRTTIFPYASPAVLDINFRKALFMRELLGYNCDVMCLQEVDQTIFEHDFRHQFGRTHLKGVYATKGPLPEGLATFYNSNKFSQISEYCIVLSDAISTDPIHHALYECIKTDTELCNRMLPLRNIVQIMVLHCKSSDKYLVVANTHLYSQPGADQIRFFQAAVIVNQIQYAIGRTIEEHKLSEHQVSAVFCGDFNSAPSDPIHQLVTQYKRHYSISGYIRSVCNYLIGKRTHENLTIENSFRFLSAYDNTMHTIFTHNFASCLDYIYYSSDRHRLIQTVPLPTIDELSEQTGIPAEKFPSDHLALVADFEWIQKSS